MKRAAPDGRAILVIIQSPDASLDGLRRTGLLERYTRLLQAYARAFRVVVHSSDNLDYSTDLGVTHRPMRWLPRPAGLRHAAYYIGLVCRARGMDGVIKVFGSNIPTLPLVRRISGCPMMVTYQYNYSEQTRMSERPGLKRWVAPLLERLALRSADLVLVTAGWLETRVQHVYGKRTVLLPNWVDLDLARGDEAASARGDSGILFAGRLHWSKGVHVLLDAFERLAQRHPAASLIIAGEGEERARLEANAARIAPGRVVFLGRVPHTEVLALMRTAAVFVLPTLTMEGHPKALIEAMACGAACVATDVPGNRDVLEDGRTGCLVPAADAAGLAEILERLLGDPPRRKALGDEARAEASAGSFSEIVPREIQVLRELAEGGRRS
jgi:glycosyltransferase involved in cell wall biosynthesis